MASDRDQKQSNSIPIRFFDADESRAEEDANWVELVEAGDDAGGNEAREPREDPPMATDDELTSGGPELAELIASRAELKRLEMALAEAQEAVARRQADFDNYRKRIERERGEAHTRIVVEVTRKLLPVLDNLNRALDAERSIETSESQEFRHFLNGVELIGRQLNEVLEAFGVEPIAAVGERFDPHVHEAVITEPSDAHEPDTVIGELARGYRIGDRLLRPAIVKVSARKSDEE